MAMSYRFCEVCKKHYQNAAGCPVCQTKYNEAPNDACADCGTTGHNTGSNTCPGPRDEREE